MLVHVSKADEHLHKNIQFIHNKVTSVQSNIWIGLKYSIGLFSAVMAAGTGNTTLEGHVSLLREILYGCSTKPRIC